MFSTAASLETGNPDVGVLTGWLAEVVDPRISSLTVTRLPGGHSSGAWRVDVLIGCETRSLVLKAPGEPSVVYRREAGREARLLDAVGRLGAPVPTVVAIDDGARTGRASFVMEHVEGRSVADVSPGGFHNDPWLREAGPDVQRAAWDAFHDSLAALHAVDATQVPDASHGPEGIADVIAYWRAALLDVAPARLVPRQLAVLDWLRASAPPGADDDPAVCMGDARIVNCLMVGADVAALVDFEVAYAGHPAADIGYSVFMEQQQRHNAPRPLPGIPEADETWARWERTTGRDGAHRDYWTAFGATVLVITASRAMVQWGLAAPSMEFDNPLIPAWESTVERARRR